MATKKWKCLGECGREFEINDWECAAGIPHIVESKTYYMADAPFMSEADKKNDPDGLALRNARTQVCCIPPVTLKDETGALFTKNYEPLLFVMGRFQTDNPLQQYYFERTKFGVSYERWFDAYHTPKQKANISQGKIVEKERELDRRERELNDLLAQAKANVKAGKPASA